MRGRSRILAAVLAVSVLVVGAVAAQQQGTPDSLPRPGWGRGMGTMGPGGGMGPGMMGGGAYMPQLLIARRQALDLNEDQVTRLEALAQRVRRAHDEAMTQMRQHGERLQELWKADEPNASQIRSQTEALMDAQQRAHLEAVTVAAEAKAVLNAEQRGRVQGWMDARRMAGRRGFARGGRGPQRGMMRGGGMHSRMHRWCPGC
jgi:Spy/CpxP family protein refolding chaperone